MSKPERPQGVVLHTGTEDIEGGCFYVKRARDGTDIWRAVFILPSTVPPPEIPRVTIEKLPGRSTIEIEVVYRLSAPESE